MRHALSATIYILAAVMANTGSADVSALLTGDMDGIERPEGTPEALAPEAEVARLDGGTARLSDWSGRPVLLNFWATWCAPCREEMPSLAALAADPESAGNVAVVTVASGRNAPPAVERFLSETGAGDLPVLLDADRILSRTAGVRQLPLTIILDGSGREIGRLSGIADWNGEDARALLSEVAAMGTGG
ncbi:TlpA disulfide reductase family protein [Roseicyclus sp. F158]|uniref:TlpA disulfide reductase family protein n=1 Tax=Tropicimonas omnivorans TaxID=3075590 RepID=A0ABU3DDC0_9RHOB|nr:TlpA disulfide reductase family protein [Roseicyclus sp. F158]MDT0681713.1 TlpA disulfide reductase family protein [Roseicyclus sp. F158]